MNYTEYIIMFAHRVEQDLINKKANERYRINQYDTNEKPQRSRPPRFWWHHDPNKADDRQR